MPTPTPPSNRAALEVAILASELGVPVVRAHRAALEDGDERIGDAAASDLDPHDVLNKDDLEESG